MTGEFRPEDTQQRQLRGMVTSDKFAAQLRGLRKEAPAGRPALLEMWVRPTKLDPRTASHFASSREPISSCRKR